MTTTSHSAPLRAVRRRWLRTVRRLRYSDRFPLGVLALFAVAVTLWGVFAPMLVPYTILLLPMFVASLWLGPKPLPWFVIFCLLCVIVLIAVQPTVSARSIVRVGVTFAIGLLIVVTSFRRARLGVSGGRSESMFVDLRDRISKQAHLPALPDDWYVDSLTRSAGGTAFAGDFLVASRDVERDTVEMVVVDVSGKGVEAGTRALLLSGAFGGLLSALPAEQFLPRASNYLLEQEWDEGFATAIHLHLNTATGEFEVRKAGHPPAVWLQAGSGGWRVLDSDGPILGLVPQPTFELVTGTLRSGDALLLYTDGVVETSRRDIASGIDKLAGRGQRLFQTGFEGGAKRMLDELEQTHDDRALLLVHRR